MKEIANQLLKQQIIDAYFNYFTAYTERNWDEMISNFAPGFTMFGTGVDEVALDMNASLAFFKREFQQGPSKMKYTIKQMGVFQVCPGVALIVLVMDMTYFSGDDCMHSLDNRTSALMVFKEGSWLISHAHWSQPDIYQSPGESLPFKQLLEENSRLELQIAQRTEELGTRNIQLRDALAKVKTLKGILPICSHCKKIRNDAGYWTKVEKYISKYTDAFFSHSICPDCLKKHYDSLIDKTKQ